MFCDETADTVMQISMSIGHCELLKPLPKNENYRQSLKYSGKHTHDAISVNFYSSFHSVTLAF